jgi:hypothetical protein
MESEPFFPTGRSIVKAVILFVAPLTVLMGGRLTGASGSSINFADNFEGATLNPFWTTFEKNGSITFPSNVKAHSGTQSVQFNMPIASDQRNLDLLHNFATPIFGTVSVWAFDSGADVPSGNFISLTVRNTSKNLTANIIARDFDLGPNNGGNYDVVPFGGGGINSGVDRTQDWHKFEITSLPNSLILAIDGKQVFSGPTGTPFDFISLQVFGPSFRPAEVVFFDDFGVSEFQSVPEPATITLLGIGIAGMASQGWRRRKPAAA